MKFFNSENVVFSSFVASFVADSIPNPGIGLSILGSGITLNVHNAHRNHYSPIEDNDKRVTKSSISVPEVTIFIAK